MNFDINRMKRSDQIIAVCGVLLFIGYFLPFFHVGNSFVTISAAGHASGFFAWAGLSLGFLAGGLGFFPALGMSWPAQLPVTKTVATLGVAALATLCLVLKFLIGFHGATRSFGLYFCVIVAIVEVVFSALTFRDSGESLPTKADFTS